MDSTTETIPTILPKSKGGRPKKYLENEFDRQAYNKLYYEKNRDKYIGEFHCLSCNMMVSLANKTRHYKGNPHLNKLKIVKEI